MDGDRACRRSGRPDGLTVYFCLFVVAVPSPKKYVDASSGRSRERILSKSCCFASCCAVVCTAVAVVHITTATIAANCCWDFEVPYRVPGMQHGVLRMYVRLYSYSSSSFGCYSPNKTIPQQLCCHSLIFLLATNSSVSHVRASERAAKPTSFQQNATYLTVRNGNIRR